MSEDFERALDELCQTSFGRRSFLMLIPLLLVACSTSEKQTQKSELTPEEEKMMAREALPAVRLNYPASKDADLQNYVSNLGAQIIKANDLNGKSYDYSFTVVDVPTVNAFALPAGRVFVTLPLLAWVRTEAELAGVLGHEVGHIEAHHVAQRIQAQRSAQSKSWWYGAAGVVTGGVVGSIGASIICPGNGTACAQQLVGMAVAAGVSAGLLIQKYSFLANSQENELEADRLGFYWSYSAGYSADHIGDFYRRLQKEWEENQTNKKVIATSLLDGMSTHPPSLVRVQQMNRLVAAITNSRQGTVSTAEFDRINKRAASLSSL